MTGVHSMNGSFSAFIKAFTIVTGVLTQAMCWGVIATVVALLARLVGRSGWEAWEQFASTHKLTFRPNNFYLGGICIAGVYRGRNLKIETFTESKTTCTRVRLDADSSSSEKRGEIAKDVPASLTSQEVFNLLMPNGALGMSGGKIAAAVGGRHLSYLQSGVIKDADELRCACDLLSDVLDGYLAMAAIGGAAVHPLEDISRQSGLLSGVAIQIMKDIARTTQQQLGDRAGRLLCPRCLVHFCAHRADLPWQPDETYYGCRLCCQSQEFIDCPQGVVAVLDAGWADAQGLHDGLLRVNWLVRRAMFDFDRVEIIRATDKDVEHFAMQVGNDTDPLRRPLYAAMRCVVNPACGLAENTLRVLESTFGRVETETLNQGEK